MTNTSNEINWKKSSGFTLIELVIVVVILGLLAVTAIPKFLDLTEQAEQANIEGMAGGFATGVSLARAQWEANGREQDASGNNFVSYDGVELSLTEEDAGESIRPGYVLGLTTITAIADVNCLEVWQNILQQPPTIDSDLTDLTTDYYVSTDTTDANDPSCHYYLKATLALSGNAYVDPANATDVGNSFSYTPSNSLVTVHIGN